MATAGLVYVMSYVPPSGYLIEAAFLALLGLTIAGWGTIGIYYTRKKWGPKDSPRFVLRAALKDALMLGTAIVVLIVLNIFGELTWLTGLAIVGLAIVGERLL